MTFELLSVPAVLLGIAVLAAALWLLQRLRVQHREVEVQTTLFWQAAIEETRARVFTQRFRHWPAWLLLVTIASLLWMLLAAPQAAATDSTRHVVMLDWSVDDPAVRESDLQAALELVGTLPTSSREVIAVGTQLETLLRPNEPVGLVALRSELPAEQSPPGLDWAIETVASRSNAQQAVTIHVIGDGVVDSTRLAAMQRDTDGQVSVTRVARKDAQPDSPVAVQTLGVSPSPGGRFDAVDVWLQFAGSESAVTADRISITSGDSPIEQSLLVGEANQFELRSVAADGSTLDVAIDGQPVGSLTLPLGGPIRVAMVGEVPAVVRELVELDPACEIVTTNADVLIGTGSECHLRFAPMTDGPAFNIQTDSGADASLAINEIVDELALRQIDATGLAEQTGAVIEVEATTGDTRQVSIWTELFSAAFDFRESRACPVVISRSIRWLANKPPMVQWAAVGERLPASSPLFHRASGSSVTTVDGRELQTTRLTTSVQAPAELAKSQVAGFSLGSSAFGLFGVLVVVLLTTEWVLYQRGHMP